MPTPWPKAQFLIGQTFALRRPTATLGGRMAPPDEQFRITSVAPHESGRGKRTFKYTLVSLEHRGDEGDGPSPTAILELLEGRLRSQARQISK